MLTPAVTSGTCLTTATNQYGRRYPAQLGDRFVICDRLSGRLKPQTAASVHRRSTVNYARFAVPPRRDGRGGRGHRAPAPTASICSPEWSRSRLGGLRQCKPLSPCGREGETRSDARPPRPMSSRGGGGTPFRAPASARAPRCRPLEVPGTET
jgi:hypothetical protein